MIGSSCPEPRRNSNPRPHQSENRSRSIGTLHLRSGNIIPCTSIKGQCSRKNFYGSQELEGLFSQIESQNAVAIRAALDVACNADAQPLEYEEFAALCDAIVFQRARTATEVVKRAKAIEDMHLFWFRCELENEKSEEFLRKFDQAWAAGEMTIAEPDASAVGRIISVMLENAPLIRDLGICLIRNRTDYPFIFSDSPVVFYNTYAYAVRNRGVIGMQCPGLQIFYPLNRWISVMLYDRDR